MFKHQKVLLALGLAATIAISGYSVTQASNTKSKSIIAAETVKAKETDKSETESKPEAEIKPSEAVAGMKDKLTVEKDAKNLDWMKGISYDEKTVKEITVDASHVDVTKAGEYTLIYTIKGINNEIETVEVKVAVVDSAKAQELADAGKEVMQTDSEIKKNSKGEEVREPETQRTVQQTSAPQSTTPQTSAPRPTTPQTSAPQPVPETEPPRQPVWHEPVYEDRWIVDQAAWDETVSEPVSEMVLRWYCNTCGADITSDPVEHLENTDCGGYHSEYIQEQTGTNTYTVHHDEIGHYEQVLIREGYWE